MFNIDTLSSYKVVIIFLYKLLNYRDKLIQIRPSSRVQTIRRRYFIIQVQMNHDKNVNIHRNVIACNHLILQSLSV